MNYNIEVSEPSDSATVGRMIFKMVQEVRPFSVKSMDERRFMRLAERMLLSGREYWAIIARHSSGDIVGILTLNENSSVQHGGRYGEISEFYVLPEHRSHGVGARLIQAAVAFGGDRQWKLLSAVSVKTITEEQDESLHEQLGFKVLGQRLEYYL